MSDNVFPQRNGGTDPDLLSEANLATAFAALAGFTSTVANGFALTPNYADNTTTISSGIAVVMSPSQAYLVEADQRTNLPLPDGDGTNHVFLGVDLTDDDDVSVHIDADDTPPATPSVKIATVDTSANETTLLNRGGTGGGGVDISDDDLGLIQSDAASITTQDNLTAVSDPNTDDGVVLDAVDTRVFVDNDGSAVDSKPLGLDFTTGLSAVNAGNGVVEVSNTGGGGGAAGFTDSGSIALQSAATANNIYRIPVYVKPGQTATVSEVGLNLSDGTTDTDVAMQLRDPSGTSVGQVSLGSAPTFTESPNMSYTNDTSSLQLADIQLINEGGTDYAPNNPDAADYVGFALKWSVA